MFLKTEYCLKYKDEIVFKFIPYNQTLQLINKQLLPLSLHSTPLNYDLVRKFCADRILMLNREYSKEILTACAIDDRNEITICIVCKALSFCDNYWIDTTRSTLNWDDVNLYQNEFSLQISEVALTGNMTEAIANNIKVDKILTGELTTKGTKAKCYMRQNGKLCLYKAETVAEIKSEVVSYYIASALKLSCSKYWTDVLFDKKCSVCQIFTSSEMELIPCRDILSAYNSSMDYNSQYYSLFMQVDPINFIKMQIFDYITLNTDRNRDNFGLLRDKGSIIGLYPIFDHDSCFKGKSINGVYFPTNLTFEKTLELLKARYSGYYAELYNDIEKFKDTLQTSDFKNLFIQYKTVEEYQSMINRLNNL